MRRIYTTAVFSLALTFVFAGITAAQQQDPQSKDKQDQRRAEFRGDEGPNAKQIEQLWQQIGQLHKQIVALEVNQSASTLTPGSARFDREKGEQDDAEQTGTAAGQNDKSPARDRLRQRSSIVGQDSDALWKQVAQVHRQLVAMEARRNSPQNSITQPRTDRAGQPDRDAASRDRADESLRGGQTADRTGRSDRDFNPFLRRYAQLHLQIIQRDVDAAERPSASSSPERQTSTSKRGSNRQSDE